MQGGAAWGRLLIMNSTLLRWLPFFVAASCLSGIIWAANSGTLGWFLVLVHSVPMGDKVAHLLGLGTLALLLNIALRGRVWSPGVGRFQVGGSLVALVITQEEFSQIWVPIRRFDLGDLLCNYLGICLAGLATRWWFRDKAASANNTFS